MSKDNNRIDQKTSVGEISASPSFPFLNYDGPTAPLKEMGFNDAVSLGSLRRMTAQERLDILGPPADEITKPLKDELP